jgi:hypothetical protein
MTGWERLGIGGLSQGFLSGRLSPSAALDDALAGAVASADAEVIRRLRRAGANAPVTRFRVLADSERSPSQ